ncbi:MAG TPA: transglycosylase domain-containing protein [Rugosimonospora sp.]|nr:transglycosylase domain-containing protein [Rugosimonospora sp.]
MNSYGDSTNSAHGRARVPGSGGAPGGNEDAPYEHYDPYREMDRQPSRASASASTGRARVGGRASVRPAGGYTDGHDPGPSGGYPGGGATGRASVGGASGRASVGRATVGEPGGFGGPFDPPGTRRPGRPSIDPFAPVPDRGAIARARSKKARRRNLVLSAIALIVMLSGLTVVGGTYYFNKVPLPADVALPESTTVYYSDGKTMMAKFGNQNRTFVALSQVSPWVPKAVVATEDNTFYTNSGISIRGILRAAWNNVKGGSTQGGSTITQQYARQVVDATVTDRTVSVKIKEAVIAMKMDQKYDKNKIMEMYLNVIYFGRGAYGIEAAAEAYFGKHAINLTVEESMVLAGVIRDPGGGSYDPMVNKQSAVDRFTNYIKPNMVKLNYISPAQANAMQYPTDVTKADATMTSAAQFGKSEPTGLVVHHVMDELTHLTKADGTPMFTKEDLQNGGYKIVTTIDKNMEADAIAAASRTNKDSPISQLGPANLQAALVSVEPKTGRVMAYYGGDQGSGFDYAGVYRDPVLGDGNWTGGHHPPGSTFKVYTMAAALQAGMSIDSYWYGPKSRDFPQENRVKGKLGPIVNAGASCPQGCPMWKALQQSMNTVFYAVGEKVGANKVLDVAHAMGINYMWANNSAYPTGQMVELTGSQPGEQLVPSKFSNELTIGQFGITVLDNATGVATVAGGGIAVKAHFVKDVTRGAQTVYSEQLKQTNLSQIGITSQMMDDEQWAMGKVLDPNAGNGDQGVILSGGRDAGGKTGTWQYGNENNENAHAWFVGFTPGQLATAVWVGNAGTEQPIRTKSGKKIFGATLPGPIWKKFMNAALKSYPKVPMPDKMDVGDPTLGELQAPAPQDTGQQTDPNQGGGGNNPICAIPLFCPSTSPNSSPTNGGNGGGNGFPNPRPSH